MAYSAQDWSMSALSVELGMDRRTVGKYLANVQPARVSGRTSYYRMATVVRAILEAKTGTGDPGKEKARLDRLRADQVEFDLAIKRKQYAPVQLLTFAISDVASQGVAILEGLPKRIKNSLPALRAREMRILNTELNKFRKTLCSIKIDFDGAGNG